LREIRFSSLYSWAMRVLSGLRSDFRLARIVEPMAESLKLRRWAIGDQIF